MIITEQQIKTLKPYITNIEQLVKEDDADQILDLLNDVIVENIIDHDDEPDAEGIRLQLIWDRIFVDNFRQD